jgi:hypothetical protein
MQQHLELYAQMDADMQDETDSLQHLHQLRLEHKVLEHITDLEDCDDSRDMVSRNRSFEFFNKIWNARRVENRGLDYQRGDSGRGRLIKESFRLYPDWWSHCSLNGISLQSNINCRGESGRLCFCLECNFAAFKFSRIG